MKRTINFILFACLFFSGIAGLIYEVLWARYLSLIFGNTTYAHTLVLASFMAGLALGSFSLGKLADRVTDRLTLYAWIEIGIAVFCIFTPKLFILSRDLYLAAAKGMGLGIFGITAVKFAIGTLIILPPTILMGGTLPVLGKFMTESLSVRGRTIARLYYVNSFGAVVGTLLAGFYFIHHFGLDLSVTIAALLNLSIGVTIVVIKTVYKKPLHMMALERKEAEAVQAGEEEPLSPIVLVIALGGIFLSGFAAMLYEIVWIRLLSSVLGSSTYSFSLMLAAFISGITIGAFLISKYMPRPQRTFVTFGLCEIMIGLALLATIPLYEMLPVLFTRLSGIFARNIHTFALYATVKFLLAFLVMLPATIFLGMTLPLVSKIASRTMKSLGKHIGGVFAVNTTGNILGASISGLLLLPLLGMRATLELGILINMAIGFAVLCADRFFSATRKLLIITACCLAMLAFKTNVPAWDNVYFTAQLFRYNVSKIDINAFFKQIKKKDIIFHKDGLDSTVSVVESRGTRALYINGKADASTGEDMSTQVLCAQLPLIMKPEAKDILVIGLGSGITCGSALLHPIESLDVIEISQTVVAAAEYFTEDNYHALDDERLALFVEDARTFMQRTDKDYDIIISEPSNPWMSGNSALFSQEYFNDCSDRLAPGGLMLQWVQSYDMNEEIFETILRTFASVFPEVTLWCTGVHDLFLIGSQEPITVNFIAAEKRLGEEAVHSDLERIGLRNLFTLLHLQLGSPQHLRGLVRWGGAIHSDSFPTLEYKAPLALYVNATIENFVAEIDERSLPLESGKLLLAEYLKERTTEPDDLENLFSYLDKHRIHNGGLLLALSEAWSAEYPDEERARYAYAVYNQESIDRSLAVLEDLVFQNNRLEHLNHYVSLLTKRYWSRRSYLLPHLYRETVQQLERSIEFADTEKVTFSYALGKVHAGNRDFDQAIASYKAAIALVEAGGSAPEVSLADLYNEISFAYLMNGNAKQSYDYAEKALTIDPTDIRALKITAFIARQLRGKPMP